MDEISGKQINVSYDLYNKKFTQSSDDLQMKSLTGDTANSIITVIIFENSCLKLR